MVLDGARREKSSYDPIRCVSTATKRGSQELQQLSITSFRTKAMPVYSGIEATGRHYVNIVTTGRLQLKTNDGRSKDLVIGNQK
jgi:hypothetical protein